MTLLTPQPSRRAVLQSASSIGAAILLGRLSTLRPIEAADTATTILRNTPETLVNDPRVSLQFGEERMILDDGLQPSMLCTQSGTLVVQSQLSKKPHPQQRIFYPYALETVVSRDGGQTWTQFPHKEGDNGVNIEGGIIQLRDGTILALETYVTPGKKSGEGRGLLYSSNDDYRTLAGPVEMTFRIPHASFHRSTDDGGRPHAAMRLHRRVIELPGGDLLTTIYTGVRAAERRRSMALR